MTSHADLFAALAAPFEPSEVKVRTQANRHLHYVTARTVMNRFDDVLGPENWWDDYVPGENSVLCRLTIRLPDGTTLTKCDAGGYAGMADQGDDDKSGYSDGYKRAAVKFGVGRYLYRDGVPRFVMERAQRPGAAPEPARPRDPGAPPAGRGEAYDGDVPAGDRDGWAGAGNTSGRGRERSAPRQPEPAAAVADGSGDWGNLPRSGKALFAWIRDMEQRHEIALVKHLNGFGKSHGFPSRFVDYDEAQVAMAYSEAARVLQQSQAAAADAYEDALAI